MSGRSTLKSSGETRPLLREVLPMATRAVAQMLVDQDEADLARRLLDQHFHGRCTCRPGCCFVLTAPAGSAGGYMIWLEAGGDPVGEVDLDPECCYVTGFDISAHPAIDQMPDWLGVVPSDGTTTSG